MPVRIRRFLLWVALHLFMKSGIYLGLGWWR